jgi:hypothetical protein
MPEVNKMQFHNLYEVLSQVFSEATSCDLYFSSYASESSKVLKITISILNNLITFGFRAENIIARVSKVIPKESRNVLVFDL